MGDGGAVRVESGVAGQIDSPERGLRRVANGIPAILDAAFGGDALSVDVGHLLEIGGGRELFVLHLIVGEASQLGQLAGSGDEIGILFRAFAVKFKLL